MRVKGIAFITRQGQVTARVGEQAWNALMAELAAKDPFFSETVVATALVPVEKLLVLNDAILARFHNNDVKAYWQLGEESGEWALTKGPYAIYLARKDARAFVEKSIPKLWSTYFDGGTIASTFDGKVADVRISNLTISHAYFENMVMGYVKRAFDLLKIKVSVNRISGFDSPGGVVHYQFEVQPG